jgi:CRISPR-associated endonuclease Csn1
MYIWGFDLGTTSIGFAVVDYDPIRTAGRIHRLGVRIFPEGVTEDKKEPRNKVRRAKRLMRRGIRRRKLRRRLLGEALREAGLLPRYGSPEWQSVMAGDPYLLRRDGLGRPLQSHELGRALYHLAKRRGFAGRGGAEKIGDPDEAAARDDAAKLKGEIADQTLGAFLAQQDKRRGRHHTREMVQDEFDRLWAAQTRHHPVLADPGFKARVRHLVFYQRPTFWRLATLGRCPWVPESALAPKASWLAQRYMVLEQLTKLRIAGANQRPLCDDELAILLDLAHRQKCVSWGGVRKVLRKLWRDGGEPEDQTFNMEVSKAERGIKGNIVEIELRRIFGTAWEDHPRCNDIRREIHERLWAADYFQVGNARIEIRRPEEAAKRRRQAAAAMKRDWGLVDAQAEALAKLELPSGWLRLSTAAVERMLPKLERGHSVGQLLNSPDFEGWRERAFPTRERPTGEILDRLPSHPRAMPELRNPTIHRALNELRKVTNNLLALYGRPDRICVELTRELKESKKRRSERLSRNKQQEAERKRAVADLAAHGINNPDRDTIEKWLLWKEANERCPYTGDHIGFDALFREDKYQVEHIWPRSRSLDNSFTNKTLCRRDVNILKGNRTPFEMYAHNPEAWQAVKLRLADCKLPEHKVRRFVKDLIADADSEDFAERQLADTGWAAREARDFLKRLWPDDRSIAPVETVNGRITAQLRHQWGLNGILDPEGKGKNRSDHRHHAIDALVVALTSRAFVKRLSDWHKVRETGVRPPQLAAPWPGLLADAKAKAAEIVVSHRVQRKVSGALHAETVMGDTGCGEMTRSGTYRLFAVRKPVERLSKSEIEAIRDPVVRDLVAQQAGEFRGDPKKAFPPFARLPGPDGEPGPEIRRVRLLVKQQLELMVRAGTGYADAAANHHIAAYRTRGGRITFRVISLREAARRIAAREPVVCRKGIDGEAFVTSLSAGDTIEFPAGHNYAGLRVVTSVWSSGQVVTEDVNDAEGHPWRPTVASIINAGARKVSVDPIGRVRPAGD